MAPMLSTHRSILMRRFMLNSQYEWIVQDPELIGGHLAIRGTRLPVSLIFECLAAGFDVDELERQYPAFPRAALTEVFKVAADLADLQALTEPIC